MFKKINIDYFSVKFIYILNKFFISENILKLKIYELFWYLAHTMYKVFPVGIHLLSKFSYKLGTYFIKFVFCCNKNHNICTLL